MQTVSENVINARLCARMFLAGARNLEKKKEWINELNVFPVPDGDTGTNMTMTIMSAADEVSALEEPTMKAVCKAMSSGSLRGARGNSGVILSQLLRGFSKAARDQKELDVPLLRIAFEKAVETAYKAVMKPKEGTILTVARGVSEKANELYEQNPQIELEAFLEGAIRYGEEVLAQTPEMLPVLKEAGVVDSGGQGLIEILKGAFDLFAGKVNEAEEEQEEETAVPAGYCVSFTLICDKDMLADAGKAMTAFLKTDTSARQACVMGEDSQIRVHAHVMHPGLLIERALELGKIRDIRLGDMESEGCCGNDIADSSVMESADDGAGDNEASFDAECALSQEEIPAAQRKDVGFVAVAAGEGLCRIFRELGTDCMIEGGQTMNPSTEDVINAIHAANAQTVFVFPNNKNIILAASQAQTMIKDVKVIVIPTKTVPQGITALISYTPDMSPEENEKVMYEEISKIQTCSITYAVRDTHIAGKEIHEGDIMGVGDKGILSVSKDIMETAVEATKEMISEDSELISIYYGEDVRPEDAQALAYRINSACPECEVELNEGGQPVYYYIISVE